MDSVDRKKRKTTQNVGPIERLIHFRQPKFLQTASDGLKTTEVEAETRFGDATRFSVGFFAGTNVSVRWKI